MGSRCSRNERLVPALSTAGSNLGGGFSGGFARGFEGLLWWFEQSPGLNTQGLSQALDVGQGDVPAAALYGRDVGAVEFALVGQALLGPAFFYTQ